MTEKPVITRRQRVLFALNKLSEALQGDVLADQATRKLWNINVQRIIRIIDGFPIEWGMLFSAFRAAADGEPIPDLADIKGNKLDASVSMDADGAVLIQSATQRLRFSHAILTASDLAVRSTALEKILGDTPVSISEQARLREVVRREHFSFEDFMQVAETLAASPHEFAVRLSGKANDRKVALSDVLPDDARHWSNLTAPRANSDTLAAFIGSELAAERRARLVFNPVSALPSIALTFSAPSLVPFDDMSALDLETRLKMLEGAVHLEDQFSLIGVFELCARWVGQDPRFVSLGERLLDALFLDMKRLETACGMFGAAFVLAFARIAEDESVNREPAYWRRLAAASHALLVVRSCGVTEIDHKELLKWAIAQSGQTYFLSLLSDFSTDPQWRPEWVEARFLVADVCGRALNVAARMPSESVPQGWKTRIEAVRAWVEDNDYQFLASFPAVMEGARRLNKPALEQMQTPIPPYERLINEPTVDHLLLLTPAIHSFGFPPQALTSLYAVVASIRREPLTGGNNLTQHALQLLAHISVLEQEIRLADVVAEASIEQLAFTDERRSTHEAVYRLVECAAADQDHDRAMSTLARRLEQVANVVRNPALLGELADLFEDLKTINPSLSALLGRAIALAKLGASKTRAA
jgi:hypothetical protein